MLLEMEILTKMIKLTLQTGYLKLKKPVSLLIIAKPESAKTSAMLEFSHIKGTYTTNNLSQKIIANKVLSMIENDGLKHLIIPDILNCIGKGKATRVGFEMMIKSLIEEGITSLDSFHIKSDKVYNPPLKCGLITAITSGSYNGVYNTTTQRTEGGLKHIWRKTGLLSRFIPFSFAYSPLKVMKIFKYIQKEEEQTKPVKHRINRTQKEIIGNSDLFSQFNILSSAIGKEAQAYGIRIMESLMSLAKANARLSGRDKVTQADIDELLKLGSWINYKFNPL